MARNPFVWCLLALNLGAAGWFLATGRLAWAVVYLGAALIQGASAWLTR